MTVTNDTRSPSHTYHSASNTHTGGGMTEMKWECVRKRGGRWMERDSINGEDEEMRKIRTKLRFGMSVPLMAEHSAKEG